MATENTASNLKSGDKFRVDGFNGPALQCGNERIFLVVPKRWGKATLGELCILAGGLGTTQRYAVPLSCPITPY